MFKYTEKAGEIEQSYEADTAQGLNELVNTMCSNNKTVPTTDGNPDTNVVIGQL